MLNMPDRKTQNSLENFALLFIDRIDANPELR